MILTVLSRYVYWRRGYLVNMGQHRYGLGSRTEEKESSGEGAGTQRNPTSLPCHCMAIALWCFRSGQTPIRRLHKSDVGLRESHPPWYCTHLSRAWLFQRERRIGSRSTVQCNESVFAARSGGWLLPGVWFHCGIIADAGKIYCLFHAYDFKFPNVIPYSFI